MNSPRVSNNNFKSSSNPSNFVYKNNNNNHNKLGWNSAMKNNKAVKDPEIDKLVEGMKNMKVKSCYYCHQPGHIKRQCPLLQQDNMNLNA